MCEVRPQAMFNALCEAIRAAHPQWPGRGGEWTVPILDTFAQLTPEGLQCLTGAPVGEGEWQYDLVWAEGDPRGDKFVSLRLALESEMQSWNAKLEAWTQEVLCDMNKVLTADCPCRVFVACRQNKVDAALQILSDAAYRYAGSPRTTLVVMLSPPEGGAQSCIARALHFPGGGQPAVELGPEVC